MSYTERYNDGVERLPDEQGLEWMLKDTRPGPSGYLKISTRSYVMPDGQVADWDILEGGRTVALVAMTAAKQVILVRMFRPGPGRIMLELPGGNVESGEDVEVAARRELLEETGYIPGEITIVGQTWLASYATHQRFAVLATECYRAPCPSRSPLREDGLEFVATTLASMDEFRHHVATGQLTDTDLAFMCLNHLDRLAES